MYTPEVLKLHLKGKYDPKADYLIETHRGAATRMIQGTHKAVGEVPDFSQNEKGTMVVMEVIPPKVSVAEKVQAVLRPKTPEVPATAVPTPSSKKSSTPTKKGIER